MTDNLETNSGKLSKDQKEELSSSRSLCNRNDVLSKNCKNKVMYNASNINNPCLYNKLKSDEHLNNVCLKANKKLPALMRIRMFLDFNKTRILFKGFFDFQFQYRPLTWMFYGRNTNRKINLLDK